MEETLKVSIDKRLQDILRKFRKVRAKTEEICAPLQTEDYVVQPVIDVSPPKWHLGHTTWFFEQFVLSEQMPGYCWYDKDFPYLFNSYYETVGKRVLRTDRGNITRPGVEEVYRFRAHVNEQIIQFLEDDSLKKTQAGLDVIELGLQHEQQHQELLVYDIKYILGNNPLFPVYTPALEKGRELASCTRDFAEIEGGVYQIGWNNPSKFCFDNELGVHKTFLHDFRIRKSLVTNEEYLEFMESGGYQDFRFWLSEAWEWVGMENLQAPYHWHKLDGDWYRFSMHGLEKVDLKAPVSHVSFYEASAFAKWKGMRLPTEQEWEIACGKLSPDLPGEANFQDSGLFEPMPQQGQHTQLYGDLWEWTESAYRPYPFFKEPEGAIGEYNGKFMINQMVLRGGSCATPRDHIRPTYRNFFHPNLRWMYSGIRLAQHV